MDQVDSRFNTNFFVATVFLKTVNLVRKNLNYNAWYRSLTIHLENRNADVYFKLDSGADVNILPHNVFKKSKSNCVFNNIYTVKCLMVILILSYIAVLPLAVQPGFEAVDY